MEEGPAGLLLWVALLLPLAHGSMSLTCGQTASAKSRDLNVSGILGGEYAPITDFPWQVSIFDHGRHICGGAILNEWWILTASHCFKVDNKSTLLVMYGVDDLRTKHSRTLKVDRLIKHPRFDDWLLDNDIALVLLNSPLNLSVNSVPICLSEVTSIEKWHECWVTGWGNTNTSFPDVLSPKLKKVDLRLVKWDKCLQKLPLVTKNMLCAGNAEAGKDACQGDSGGPLVCHKKKNKYRWYQVGIVSWGVGCGLKDVPGVYTKVSNYLLWINKETTKAGKPFAHEPDSGDHLHLASWATLFLYFVILLLSW